MEERETELRWPDLLNLYLWHRYGSEFVQDDTAYIAALRVEKWVNKAIGALEREPTTEER